mgnify:CR=1 FL=1
MENLNNTQYFTVQKEPELQVRDVLEIVFRALSEKGYNPVNQIVGYIMSGDPTYITSHNNARSLIMKVERGRTCRRSFTCIHQKQFLGNNPVRENYADFRIGFSGSKTVGVAVSDALLITAQGVEIIRRKAPTKLRQTLARIEQLVSEYEVEKIVLGYPKNMNSTEGERCEKTKEFKEMLEKRCGLPVILWDERLTTVAADRSMMETGIRRENRKEYVDEIAAIFILQGYLDYLSNHPEEK